MITIYIWHEWIFKTHIKARQALINWMMNGIQKELEEEIKVLLKE